VEAEVLHVSRGAIMLAAVACLFIVALAAILVFMFTLSPHHNQDHRRSSR
jgi:uncharacterized membrane protein